MTNLTPEAIERINEKVSNDNISFAKDGSLLVGFVDRDSFKVIPFSLEGAKETVEWYRDAKETMRDLTTILELVERESGEECIECGTQELTPNGIAKYCEDHKWEMETVEKASEDNES